MLISKSYIKEQRRMHLNERYGAASKKFANQIARLILALNPKSMLDYGAGKQALGLALEKIGIDIPVSAYDPGVREISELPEGRFDLVCCVDVLEHVEPECLEEVIASVALKTGVVAFITIHTGPAGKKLSDGRNAHLIQKPLAWWEARLKVCFKTVEACMHDDITIIAICEPWND